MSLREASLAPLGLACFQLTPKACAVVAFLRRFPLKREAGVAALRLQFGEGFFYVAGGAVVGIELQHPLEFLLGKSGVAGFFVG